MKALSSLLVAAFSFSAFVAMAEDIIIEARPEGQNYDRYKETAGKWGDSNNPPLTAKSGAAKLTPQGQCGSRKFVIGAPGTDPKQIIGSARFTPKVSAAGHYNVYVTFPKASNATPVYYVIKHAKGEEKKELAQDGWGGVGNPNSSTWISLGDYDFAPGEDNYVEMQVPSTAGSPDPRTGPQAFTDGMRFSTEPVTEAVPLRTSAAPTPQPFAPVTPATGTAGAAGAATPLSTPAPIADAKTPDTANLTWSEDIKSAQDDASRSGKKIFMFFYSPESERSNNYDKKVFNDTRVKQALRQGYVLVRVNIDENRSLANNLQVFRAGTINIYDDRGNGVSQFTETLDAEDLAAKLKGL